MSSDDNVQLMRRWFQEVWNEGRIQTVHELLSPDAVATGQRGAESKIRGPEEFEKFVREFRGAFPDIKVAIECEGGIFSGGAHTRGKHYASDCEKYNAMTMLGWSPFM